MAGPITISVLGDTRDLVRGVGTADRSLTGLGKKSSVTGRIVKAGFLAMGAGALYAGKKLIDFTKAAAEDEAAQVKLHQTLRKTTGATDAQVAGVERWITKQGQLLGVTDDELRPALQRMSEGTHSVTKAQEMVALAMDVSAGTGKSLKSVTEALLRAQNGSIGGLSRYGIATKDASGEVLSLKEVTEGMAETFGGQAAKAADTAAGQYGRLKLTLDETGEAIGGKLLPYATDLADWANNEGIPAAQDWWKETANTRAELIKTAGAVKDDFLPPLKTLANVAGDVVGFVADLPGPVKTFGAEAAAAAFILPRLNNAITAVKGSAGGLVGNLRNAETRTAALRQAARLAAGAGGLALITDASNDADGALKDLKQTAGITALAFAAGGPWTAAVAGFVSIVGKAQGAGEDFGLSQDEMRQQIDKVTESLNRQTGAFTRRTRQQVVTDLGDKGLLSTAKDLGLELPSVTRAIMGGAEAVERFRDKAMRTVPATTENRTKLIELTEAMYDMGGALRSGQRGFMLEREAMGQSGAKLQKHRELVDGLSKTYDLLPRQVETIFEAVGSKATTKEVRTLARQYELTPKEVRTLLEVLGVDKAVKETKRAKGALEDAGRTKPDTRQWEAGLGAALAAGRRIADQGIAGVNRALSDGTRQAKPDLGPFGADLGAGINRLTGQAFSGGSRVGSELAAGAAAGIANNAWQAVNAAGAMVADAVREANRRGDIHSPSRKTYKTGRELARGAANGLTDHQKEVRAAAKRLINGVLEDLNSGISTMRDKLKGLERARDDYIRGIQEAARLPLADAGLLEDNTQTAAGIKADLQARLDAVRNFQAKVQTLIGQGLKGDALRQLLDAGVETGTVTAEALLSGGKQAVRDAVSLTNQIRDAAGDLGQIGAKHFHAAGIKAQRQLIAGLERDRNRLDNAGRTMGVRLANAIRKELRRGLGDYDPVTTRNRRNRATLDRDVATHARRARGADRAPASVTVTLTAEQLSAIERGKRVQLDLDAFHNAGGRRRS